MSDKNESWSLPWHDLQKSIVKNFADDLPAQKRFKDKALSTGGVHTNSWLMRARDRMPMFIG